MFVSITFSSLKFHYLVFNVSFNVMQHKGWSLLAKNSRFWRFNFSSSGAAIDFWSVTFGCVREWHNNPQVFWMLLWGKVIFDFKKVEDNRVFFLVSCFFVPLSVRLHLRVEFLPSALQQVAPFSMRFFPFHQLLVLTHICVLRNNSSKIKVDHHGLLWAYRSVRISVIYSNSFFSKSHGALFPSLSFLNDDRQSWHHQTKEEFVM